MVRRRNVQRGRGKPADQIGGERIDPFYEGYGKSSERQKAFDTDATVQVPEHVVIVPPSGVKKLLHYAGRHIFNHGAESCAHKKEQHHVGDVP